MPPRTPSVLRRRARRRRTLIRRAIAGLAAALTVAAGSSTASATTAVSSNWAGYAVSGTTFSTVSGSWTQPAAACTSSSAATTASAFWVGLGGNSEASTALEQTGTEADCLATGTVRYTAWYELVPSASVKVALAVSAGDKITASVRVNGTKVTVQLRNLTSGRSFARTLRMSSPDITSAEWIAEAPSAVTPSGTTVLPLTDFGTVRFTGSPATSTGGHTGSISDSTWQATRVQLASGSSGPGAFGPLAPASNGTAAVSSTLRSVGTAFTVTWSRLDTTPGPAHQL